MGIIKKKREEQPENDLPVAKKSKSSKKETTNESLKKDIVESVKNSEKSHKYEKKNKGDQIFEKKNKGDKVFEKKNKGDKVFEKKHNKFEFKNGQKGKSFQTGGPGDEKVDWKKMKAEKKQLKVKRKQASHGDEGVKNYELGLEAKKIWEEVRREDCKGDRKVVLSKELYGTIKGKAKQFIYAHDTVRVVETLMAVGSEEYRTALFEELKDELPNLMKNKYSRFFVLKVLRYGTRAQKDEIIEAFNGRVVKLMKHKIASDVVELAYNDFANSKQRSCMIQEFFGPQFRLFKEHDLHNLDDVLKKYPEKKDTILKDMGTSLQPLLDKGVFTNTMVHTLLKEYLTYCNTADRPAIIEAIREGLLPIAHTRDGARTAMLSLWHGTNKDRKTILKSFKGHMLKLSGEEYAYLILLAAIDCMDDTVFIKKVVLSELLEDLQYLISSESGRRIFKYLVAPRSKSFFHPDILKVLQQGDDNASSKKDSNIRRQEIYATISDSVLQFVLKNIDAWSKDSHWTLFVGAALNSLSGDLMEDIFVKLGKLCAEPYIPGEDCHFLEMSHTNKLLTYIIKADKERHANGKITLSQVIINEAESEVRGWILTNRGCFLLINLIETEIPDVVASIKVIVTPVQKKLKNLDFKGAEILLQKLK